MIAKIFIDLRGGFGVTITLLASLHSTTGRRAVDRQAG